MQLSIIAAMAENYVIGQENRLPWHLPADLKHFKQLTWGKPIIMGRKTYESIAKALPGRRNIIVTRNTQFQAQDCEIAHSLEQALSLCEGSEEVMLIGGAELFAQALPKASRLYLTIIHHEFAGDCFFPRWDAQQWREIERVDYSSNENNFYPFSFVTFDAILPPSF